MSKKTKVGLVIGFILVAGIFYYVGNQHGISKSQSLAQNANGFARNGGANGGGGLNGAQRGTKAGGGFVSGQIVSKDASSITVQLSALGGQNGANGQVSTNQGQGSKIVFYTDKTSVMKTTDGILDDLAIGKQVSITGAANPDGSVNAQSIQIRPTIPVKQ